MLLPVAHAHSVHHGSTRYGRRQTDDALRRAVFSRCVHRLASTDGSILARISSTVSSSFVSLLMTSAIMCFLVIVISNSLFFFLAVITLTNGAMS